MLHIFSYLARPYIHNRTIFARNVHEELTFRLAKIYVLASVHTDTFFYTEMVFGVKPQQYMRSNKSNQVNNIRFYIHTVCSFGINFISISCNNCSSIEYPGRRNYFYLPGLFPHGILVFLCFLLKRKSVILLLHTKLID